MKIQWALLVLTAIVLISCGGVTVTPPPTPPRNTTPPPPVTQPGDGGDPKPITNPKPKPLDVRTAVQSIPSVITSNTNNYGRSILTVHSHQQAISDSTLETLRPALEA